MSEFKREHRYWVFKRKHMSGTEDAALRRTSNNLKLLDPEITPNCVVVEEDWPEYEVVWEMVQDRVEGRPNRILKLESELSTLKAQREWVSVGEKLPSSAMSQRVLVYSPERGVEHGYWSGDYFHDEADDITHWMPLPPAPEGE